MRLFLSVLCLTHYCLGNHHQIIEIDADARVPSLGASTTPEPPLKALKPSPKRYKCGFAMSKGCHCSKQEGSLSISCFKKGLKKVPAFDFGPTVVRTMNLEKNRIESINIGDFFGLKIERLLLGNNSLSKLDFLALWGLEYNLDTLDLGFNQFTSVPSDALRLLRNVRTLSLTANKITALRNYEFSYLHKLEVLSLDSNPIGYMEPRTFAGTNLFMMILDQIDLVNGLKTIPTRDLSRLKGLSLKKNGIDVIPRGWMKNLTSLRYLNMDHNKLHTIQDDAFKGVQYTLRTLHLNHNRIRKIPTEAIRILTNLESLELSLNKIKRLVARNFNNSRALQTLDLRHNNIKDMDKHALDGMDMLNRLDLRYNKLVTLDDRTFYWKNMTGRNIYISENEYLCNCLLKWLKKAYRKRTPLIGIFADVHDARCKRPIVLETRPIIRVPLKQFNCDLDYYYYSYEDYGEEYATGNEDDEDDFETETEDTIAKY